ncbi:MAG: hypothetical protein ACRDU4_02725 [Mycobacterium sp.]
MIADAGRVAPMLFRAPSGDWSAAVPSAVADLAALRPESVKPFSIIPN